MKRLLFNRYSICFDFDSPLSRYERKHFNATFSKYREFSELLLPVFSGSDSFINRR